MKTDKENWKILTEEFITKMSTVKRRNQPEFIDQDSAFMVAKGIEFAIENLKHIPLVAELVKAHEGAITRDINGDTRIDSHAYREIKLALQKLEG